MDYISTIKKYLNRSGKTQAELARLMGMNVRRLSKLLAMDRKANADDLQKIETYFKNLE